MGKKLLFIYNPKSGRGLVAHQLSDMVDICVKAGFDVTVRPTQEEKDACVFAKEHASEYDRIVACGGDEIEGLDYLLATKVFRKFEVLNLSLIRDEIKGLEA